jgi:hypothetical protein
MANNVNSMGTMTDAQYQQNIRAGHQNLQATQEEYRREHLHKAHGGNNRVIPIHEAKAYIPDKDKYPASTVYCTGCGAIFESETYRPDELNSGIYMFNSMLHQIKMVANLTDEERELLRGGYQSLDKLSQIITYYNDMADKLSNGGKNNGKKNHGSGKGHIGVDSSMFGGRGF